eukprot:4079353-Pyramimonas_sp.AAC.1
MGYGVASKNPFDLLGDENEDLSAIAARAANAEAKKAQAEADAKKAAAADEKSGTRSMPEDGADSQSVGDS